MSITPEEFERQQLLQQLRDSTAAINDSFQQLAADVPNAQLPEAIFYNSFLPYFAGKIPPEQSKDMTAQWIAIAGNPTREVDLIDNKGNVTVTVPAIYDTHSLSVLRPIERVQNGPTVSQIVNAAKLREGHIRGSGKAFFEGHMDRQVDGLIDKGAIGEQGHSQSATAAKWQAVFERFGVAEGGNKPTGDAARDDSPMDLDFD